MSRPRAETRCSGTGTPPGPHIMVMGSDGTKGPVAGMIMGLRLLAVRIVVSGAARALVGGERVAREAAQRFLRERRAAGLDDELDAVGEMNVGAHRDVAGARGGCAGGCYAWRGRGPLRAFAAHEGAD